MVGEEYYKLEINPKEKYLKVSLMLEAISKDGYIYDLMRAMAPADMVVQVMIIFNRHRSFKPYTHYQLRTATDFETEFNTQAHLATYRHNQLSSYMQSALMTQKL